MRRKKEAKGVTEADKKMYEAGFKPQTKANALRIYNSELAHVRFRERESKVYIEGLIDMEELEAIREKCKELGWIK